MAGLATRLLCARRVAAELMASNSPAAAIIKNHESFYYLGALGPAIGDFVPSEKPQGFGSLARTPYLTLWIRILEIAVGNDAKGLPGVVPTLRGFQDVLSAVQNAVDHKSVGELKDIKDSGDLDKIDGLSTDLGTILTYFSDLSRLVELGQLMGMASRPVIDDPNNLIPEALWTGRDWLSWKGTGEFASALMDAATNDSHRAYALGWQVSYATLLSTSSYVTSAVGSVYRTHWWRHRWVSNFIDAWVWGFYDADGRPRGAPVAGPFAPWRSLCNGKLHSWIDMTNGGWDYEAVARAMAAEQTLPEMLPADFAGFWMDAFTQAYGTVTPQLFSEARLQQAYAALGTVLWFQTSGSVIGCNPIPGGPPDSCGASAAPPEWVDPTVTNPATGAPFQPPVPEAESDPDIAKIISGIILALLGIAAIIFGGYLVGAAALAGGIALIVDGAMQPDWDKLNCDLYWLSVYLHNGLETLHRLTVFGGVQHPYSRDLDVDQLMLAFNGSQLPFTSGPAVIRSRGIDSLRQPWGGVVSTWGSYPTDPTETPVFRVLPFGAGLWPNLAFDDIGVNPQVADLRLAPDPWPVGSTKGSFGPGVQNALRVINQPVGTLPNWNLDGDRGLGWLTWTLKAPYSVPVDAIPEP